MTDRRFRFPRKSGAPSTLQHHQATFTIRVMGRRGTLRVPCPDKSHTVSTQVAPHAILYQTLSEYLGKQLRLISGRFRFRLTSRGYGSKKILLPLTKVYGA
ncbi:hypothetical protein TNCV_1806021 [Trichonephila clavipes]|nr:hypothetical protein TNCV_1806021 [Trichonephila clavipes]